MMTHHSTSNHYDYVVIGSGAIGSMALWQLSERRPEASILGIERFDRVHTKGSYSGESRLFRVALKEGGIYIPLVQEAREMWMAMNERSGRDIFLPVGAISVAPEGFPGLIQTQRVIDEFGLDHEILDAAALAERFPVFTTTTPGSALDSAPDAAILDPAGGGIRPEVAVAVAQEFALEAGATLWDNTQVMAVSPGAGPSGETLIQTDRGEITATKVIVTNGSWAADLFPDLATHVRVQTLPLTWYLPLDITGYQPGNLPIFMRDIITDTGDIWHCYGAPTLDGYSVKISHGDFIGDADTPDGLESLRTGVLPEEIIEVFSARTSAFFAGVLDAPVRITLHHDGFTADHAPILDTVPGSSGAIIVATGMSGNGMKFAPVYGRIAAELAITGESASRPTAFDYPISDRQPSPSVIPATLH